MKTMTSSPFLLEARLCGYEQVCAMALLAPSSPVNEQGCAITLLLAWTRDRRKTAR